METYQYRHCSNLTAIANITNNSSCYDNPMHGHSLSNEFSYTIATYFVFLTAAAVTFNGLLILIIVMKRSLHSSPNLFIVNLALCDMLVALAILPFDTDFLLRGYYGYGVFVCGLKETVFMFSLPASIVNLFLLTMERFVLIVYPYKHCKVFTKKNIMAMLLFAWSYVISVALFPFIMDSNAAMVNSGHCHLIFPFEYVLYQLSVNFLFPLVLIIIMNFIVYRVASRHSRNIKKQNSTSTPRLRKRNRKSTRTTIRNMLPSNFKAAKHIMVLVTVCLTCWLTYIILVIWNIMCRICHPREVTWTGNAINYSSIVLNPVLYGLLNKKVRKVLRRSGGRSSAETMKLQHAKQGRLGEKSADF